MNQQQKQKIFYDGDCTMCTALATSITDSKKSEHFELEDITTAALPADISPEAAQKEIHVIKTDGTIVKGVAAIAEILKQYGWWGGVIGSIILFPGIRSISRLVYRFVAKYRHIFFRKKQDK